MLKNGGLNQWINIKIIPRLLRIHLSFLVKSSRLSAGQVETYFYSHMVLHAKP